MSKVDDIHLKGFEVKGYRCKCGNEISDSEDVDNIVKFLVFVKKQKKMQVFKSGNSLAIRIPKAIAKVYGIKENDQLLFQPKKDEIVLKLVE
jgi:hypothetical protein